MTEVEVEKAKELATSLNFSYEDNFPDHRMLLLVVGLRTSYLVLIRAQVFFFDFSERSTNFPINWLLKIIAEF